MSQQFDNRQKNELKIDPNKAENKLDQANMPESNRDEVRRQFKSVDQTKGGELLNKGIRDRSNDAGRDAILDPGRTARPEMMAMVSTVFPELSTSTSPQRDAFIKAFENPALVRSYLINPQETAALLMERFPELKDMILKNMPFQQIGAHIEVNPASGLYQRTFKEVDGGVKASNSFVRKEMDKLLSSPIGARLGGSAGMETKAYELIRNRIESEGQFNKKGAILEADISRLMKSPQAQQDLKEAQALANKGPLPTANGTQFISTTPPPSETPPSAQGGIPVQGGGTIDPSTLKPAQPQFLNPGAAAPSGGIPVQGGGSIDGAGLRSVTPSPQGELTAPPPNATIPGQPSTTPPATPTPATPSPEKAATPAPAAAQPAPSAPLSATPTPATPAPATPTPAPAMKESPEVQALKERIAQLEAQVAKQAAPAAPALSEETKQLQQQNKDLNDRMAKIEKVVEETAKKNAELERRAADFEKKAADIEKKAAELEKKNQELEKRNQELEKKNAELEKKVADPKAKTPEPDKKELSYEEVKDKAKALYDSMSGLGTNEALLIKTLSQLDKEGQKKVADFYNKTYNEDLDEAIESELSGSYLAVAKKLREGASPGTADAVQIYNAVEGLGTDEAAIRSAFKGKTPEEAKVIAGEYQRLFGESLETALRGDLSGAELDNTLKLLHSGEMEKAASALYTAMDGAGTNEADVMRTLAKFNAKQQEELATVYKRQYGTDLDKDLAGDFSGQELAAVKKLRAGVAPGAAEAVELFHALDGWGTDEAVVAKAVKDKTPEQMSQIAAQYRALFNSSLDTDLKGDLSGKELENALKNLKGSTYDLHEMIESGKAAKPEGYREARKVIKDNPAAVEEYKSWYGKDPMEELNSSPAVKSARIRREAAQKALRETDFLDDGAAPTPAAPSPSAPPAAPTEGPAPTPQPDVTMNTMIDLLKRDGGAPAVRDFLFQDGVALMGRSDDEIRKAFNTVDRLELGKFVRMVQVEEETAQNWLSEDEFKHLSRVKTIAQELATD